jgi:hypothetical protein
MLDYFSFLFFSFFKIDVLAGLFVFILALK